MRFTPSIRKSPRNAPAGFSLVELLVTLLIASVMMTVMTGFFRASVGTRHDMGLQTEAQQGLRAIFELVTQELRQAGACLPQTGQFIILAGVDNGDLDELTLRIGRTDEDTLRCVKAGTTEAVTSGTVLQLGAGEGDLFAGAALAYVTPNGAIGNFYSIVAHTSDSVTIDDSVTLPVGAGVYAVDERVYRAETMNGRDVLSVTIDGGQAYPLVEGVKEFNVIYWLEAVDPDDPMVDQSYPPDNDADWRRVRMLTIAGDVEARDHKRDGGTMHEEGHTDVKPRNLL